MKLEEGEGVPPMTLELAFKVRAIVKEFLESRYLFQAIDKLHSLGFSDKAAWNICWRSTNNQRGVE